MKQIKEEKFEEWAVTAVKSLVDFSTFDILYHRHRLGVPMLSSDKLKIFVDKMRQIIFPGYFGEMNLRNESMHYYIGVLIDQIYELLVEQICAGLCFNFDNDKDLRIGDKKKLAEKISAGFINGIPELRRKLITDVKAAYLADPAANNVGEVIFCYPGTRAISSYRMANSLHKLGVPLIPRIITEIAHSETGIDINPEAEIGEYFTIDHGTGVVIGSTCIIGNHVILYQGVTLGAKSFPLDKFGNPTKGIPRHPIVEDNVIIYSNATILGRITIGHDSIIGGNVWITKNLPPYSKAGQSKSRAADFLNGGGI